MVGSPSPSQYPAGWQPALQISGTSTQRTPEAHLAHVLRTSFVKRDVVMLCLIELLESAYRICSRGGGLCSVHFFASAWYFTIVSLSNPSLIVLKAFL